MRVKEICSREVKSCTRSASLAEAGHLMQLGDFGALPVVDAHNKVVGIVTDRDLCAALSTQKRSAFLIAIGEILGSELHTCMMNDGIREALKTMRTAKVRRLPVVDAGGLLQGMLSLSDVALAAKPDRCAEPTDVTDEDLALAIKTICGRRLPLESRVPAPATTTLV